MSELSINDIFHEIFDENKRLIDEFSLNNRFVEVLQKFRQLLASVCNESDCNEDIELRQQFNDLENEYKTLEEEIKTIKTGKERKSTELRNQMNDELNQKTKRVTRSKITIEVSEEDDDMFADDLKKADNVSQNKTNVKFLSKTDRLLEEDGTVVTQMDPKNPSILVVRMNDSSEQIFGFRCNWSDCQYVSVSKAKVDTHLRSVHDRNGLFICQKCKSKFVSQKLLSTHMNCDHSKQYKCDYNDCGFQCRTRQHLTDHLRRHTGERPYVCAVDNCGKAFATRQELRRHHKGVHSNETFVCDWPGCQLTFKSNKGLKYHSNIHIMS